MNANEKRILIDLIEEKINEHLDKRKKKFFKGKDNYLVFERVDNPEIKSSYHFCQADYDLKKLKTDLIDIVQQQFEFVCPD